jgi:hypothetical protein
MSDIVVTTKYDVIAVTTTMQSPWVDWHEIGFGVDTYGYDEVNSYGFFDHTYADGAIVVTTTD